MGWQVERFLCFGIQTRVGGQLKSGGAAGETFDRGPIVGGGHIGGMGVPIAVLAEEEVVGETPNGHRLRSAAIADL